ncbi:MAG: proton-conducting transporter transmembrane domain-containing protein [Ktedonobacteraceae bacterium]
MNWNQLPGFAFWTMFVLFLLGALLPLVLQKARISTITAAICAGLGSVAAMVAGIGVLSGAPPPAGILETNLPFGALTLKLDTLSAFFLVVIGLVSLSVAIYSVGYMSHHVGRRVMAFSTLFNLLLLSLVLIVAASDMIVFLMAWEAMAFLSYIMVNFDYEDTHVIRSGYLMLAISELGTIGIFVAFLLLYQASGSFGFDALRAAAPMLPVPLRNAVFLLAFAGFGAKAGILPLQLWLPEAHPAAPSHISALLSAVIIKLGIYGMLRFMLDFLGGPGTAPVWWGLVILSIGALTALVGILYSVVQNDLKRLLAYSSIENIGIILAGLGATLTFRAYHLMALAAIAAIVTLYHILNHAVYKGLLFLGAGSVQHATGTRELAKLGGLIRLMPWTALFFIVAALAISAVPPFNGYISEWMLLETMLQSFAIPDTLTKVLMAVSGGMLALTAGIAVTAFVRAYGVAFLALPRSKEAMAAHESPRSMRIAMGLLAFCCLALGVLPTFVITVLDRVTTPLIGQSVINQVVPPLFTNNPGAYQLLDTIGGTLFKGLPVNGLVVIASPNFSTIDSPSYLLLAELLLVGLLLLVLRLIRPLGKKRKGRVWAGGIPRFEAKMTYTELAYSNPIRIIFNGLFRSQTRTEATALAARHGEGHISYQQEVPPPFERFLYRPILRAWGFVTRSVRIIQSGNINQYIFYIFMIVLIALILRAI